MLTEVALSLLLIFLLNRWLSVIYWSRLSYLYSVLNMGRKEKSRETVAKVWFQFQEETNTRGKTDQVNQFKGLSTGIQAPGDMIGRHTIQTVIALSTETKQVSLCVSVGMCVCVCMSV